MTLLGSITSITTNNKTKVNSINVDKSLNICSNSPVYNEQCRWNPNILWRHGGGRNNFTAA
ncbi:hypothetical protein DDB_G0281769 [Dictyostelium discoideum AX4]|uniref:Uncharacterized protein n=1 Tax=Dictyostelium discoideum TaxID=44689 RepID=Q54TG3_DICDI|nr:hypothetical protein DDB_G0281769 [Dictyostelium discoideum AX4]EAL66646.1 hypothetical protein DDB_G0281769 [Dictyostelium discoideum AX4]|eukprot:XP_640628.1 hypothetical protein DDB_G0281769 [Dictyostelium discoideum AX4]